MIFRSLIKSVVVFSLIGCGEEKLPENANGKQLYEHYCAGCHGKDGSGNFLKGIPANSKSRLGASEIMALIRKGKADKPGMPVFENLAYKDALLISNYVKEQLSK